MKNKSRQTEEKILEAALELFSERGYAGTATSEIAKAANVAEGTIFRYFPQKKDLLFRVVLKFIDTFGEQIVLGSLEKLYLENPEAPLEELLKLIIRDRLQLLDKMGSHLKVLLVEMQYHPELGEMIAARVGFKAIQFGEKVIKEFVSRGIIRSDILPMVAFRSFVGMTMAMAAQRRFLPGQALESLDLDSEIAMIVDIFINGVKNREAL